MDTKAIADSFTKHFADFKMQHDKASAMLDEVRGKISELESEAQALRQAPLNCADFTTYLLGVVGEFASEGRANMQATIGTARSHERGAQQRGPTLSAKAFAWASMDTEASRKAIVGNTFSALLTAWNPGRGYNFETHFDLVSVCTLFEDVVKASITKNLAALQWPYPDAQPVAQREKRMAEIEAGLQVLRKNESELVGMLAKMAVLQDAA